MIHRGIVVVHGVGESAKGDYLDSFVEPLASFLGDALGSENVQVVARNEPDLGTTSWATLELRDAATGKAREHWHIREAWWTRTFSPSSPQTVLFWAVIAGATLLWSTFRYLLLRPFLRVFVRSRLDHVCFGRADLYGRPLDAKGNHAKEDDEGVWLVARASWWKALADSLVWLIIAIGYLVVFAAGLVVIVPLYLFLLMPLTFLLPARVGEIQRKIAGLLVRTIGDQQAMTTRRFALASASNEVSRALWPMLSAEGLHRTRGSEEEFNGYTTVTVVAHSGGAVVSFDALATQVRGFMRQRLEPGLSRPARINWVTAGSGLNLAYNMRRSGNRRETAFWDRPIGSFVNWLNIYARHDAVAVGPAPRGMVDRICGPGPWSPGARAATRPPFVALRVVNDDFPLTDHFGYWENREEVMSRIVHLVAADELASAPIDPQKFAFATGSLPKIRGAVETMVHGGRRHRNLVLLRQTPLYLGIVLFVVALRFWSADIGAWLLGNASFRGIDAVQLGGRTLEEFVPKTIAGIGIEAYRDWLFGAFAIAFVALVAVQLVRLFAGLLQRLAEGGSLLLVAAPAAGLAGAGLAVWFVISHGA
jgi:hypothetical protein